jgi:hypothetical protein
MSTQLHDFHERNSWSLSKGHEPFWFAVYQKAFPSLVSADLVTDLKYQRMGVDRLLALGNGIQLTVDEKKRECTDTGDILLEYKHTGLYNADGWIEKDLTIDYLAYAFIPNRRCYLFDWRMLQRAWCQHKNEWMLKCQHIKSPNKRYETWCLAVPTPILQRAVLSATVIEV